MQAITGESVTIEINGHSYDAVVNGYHYPRLAPSFEEQGESEQFDLDGLSIEVNDNWVDVSQMLAIETVYDDILSQLKKAKEG
jgi:hypothetical protein